MDRIGPINAERILWCCRDRDISPENVASEVGISQSTFQRVLDGQIGVTFNQLRRLADRFNRDVLFFLETGPTNDRRVYTPQFRTLASQKPHLHGKLKSIIERAEWHREVYIYLQEELGLSSRRAFSGPAINRNDIEDAAGRTRRWLQLQDHNTFDSYRKAVEAKGIIVIRSMGYKGAWQFPNDSEIVGFSLSFAQYPVIVVRKQPTETRQAFTLMHELGHLLLDGSSFIDEEQDLFSYRGKERAANNFAGLVLVPDTYLEQIEDSRRPAQASDYPAWLKPFRDRWGVSTEVILRRLLDSGRLRSRQYEAFRSWQRDQSPQRHKGGARMYRAREPIHIFGDRYVRVVLDALHNKRITWARASAYLDNLKVQDVRRLEDYYAHL